MPSMICPMTACPFGNPTLVATTNGLTPPCQDNLPLEEAGGYPGGDDRYQGQHEGGGEGEDRAEHQQAGELAEDEGHHGEYHYRGDVLRAARVVDARRHGHGGGYSDEGEQGCAQEQEQQPRG